ncbi:hypothetical protein SLEP1_g20734 [Rubroshorea leprosula]|uniref:Uncharacterized protein n=1 Tax=Rubroshorea leprosula TaxID=152421 RepID=A0AAV5JCQ9_9ROSI|nr:hypothetical protein SLEP1_g20734 [Rubroshorea leprosula]
MGFLEGGDLKSKRLKILRLMVKSGRRERSVKKVTT